MARYLAAERAAARAAVRKLTGREWWTLNTYAHPAAGRVIHVSFKDANGEPQRGGLAYLYDADTGAITVCAARLHPLLALGVDPTSI